MKLFLILAIAASAIPVSACAHEFWLEPEKYQVEIGESINAALINGQNFEGVSLPFNESSYLGFVRDLDGIVTDVSGRLGDRPGLQTSIDQSGLVVYGYTSTLAHVNYTFWDKFQKFVDHKDFGDVRNRHEARGLDSEIFKEAYTRFAKTLIGVGDSQGSDRQLGLETELVALQNPYTDPMENGFEVQAFYNAAPRQNTQIELFEKAPDGTVTITLHQTNAMGISSLPVKAGHSYLVDAVVLREPNAEVAEERGAVWETLWASLTFAIPE